MRIATTTGDFVPFASYPLHMQEILPWLKECGFRHIDLNMYEGDNPDSPLYGEKWAEWTEETAALAQKLGLDFVQAHGASCWEQDYEARLALLRRQLHVCKRLDIPYMVVHAMAEKGDTRRRFIRQNASFYRDLLVTAEETGVAVLTENTCVTNSPYYYIVNADDFHDLDEAVGHHPLFGMCWDVGHAHIQGVDQYQEIVSLGSRLRAVHIHDNMGRKDSPGFMDFHMQPFTGNMNYDAIIQGLIDADFKGTFTLEANALPQPARHLGRKPFEKNGEVCEKLMTLPVAFKLQAETLMHDITKYMLEVHDCYEL